MFVPSKLEMAQQYLHAANVLADTIMRQEEEDFRMANPVLFLYRHAIEMALKALLQTESAHHRLDALGADLRIHVRTKYHQDVPAWITERLNQLAAIDPSSMAFRYAEERYDGSRTLSSVPGELYVGVPHLRASMNELFGALAGAAEKMGAASSHEG
jgi:hypothetical protein